MDAEKRELSPYNLKKMETDLEEGLEVAGKFYLYVNDYILK